MFWLESVFSLAALESKLVAYVQDSNASNVPFDASSIPKISKEQARQESARPSALETAHTIPTPKAPTSTAPAPSAAEVKSAYSKQLAAVPEFESYGPVINSSPKPAQLTESETEYTVSCVKHVFKEHIVFQFNVSNTLLDTILENVSVLMQATSEVDLTEDFIIPAPQITSTNSPQIVFVSFTRENPTEYTLGSFACTLKFVSKECDPSSGEPEEEGYEDEYQVEEVEVAGSEYIVPTYASFESEWAKMANGPSVVETFALSAMESIKTACESIIEILNMEPLGGSELPTSQSVHTLILAGIVAGGDGKVFVRARMTYSTGAGVTLELGVRAEKEAVCNLVVTAIGG